MSGFVTNLRPLPLRFPNYVARGWDVLCRHRIERETRRQLSEMDPRQLSDIGASRADVVWAVSRPVWDQFRYNLPS